VARAASVKDVALTAICFRGQYSQQQVSAAVVVMDTSGCWQDVT
jgi:hypothetical protein